MTFVSKLIISSMNYLKILFIIANILVLINCNEKHSNDAIPKTDEDEFGDDYTYDHNAILGKDKSKEFDKLTPEESKRRLSEIFDKMDKNGDQQVDMGELKEWIRNVYDGILKDDIMDKWKNNVLEGREKIDFKTYMDKTYGHLNLNEHPNIESQNERRWKLADQDGDGLLNQTEFLRLIHPENFPDLKPLLAQETLEVMDKNNDSYVDINEYLEDQFPPGSQPKEEWIRYERQNFGHERDVNKDGFMDRDEIQRWLMPDSYDRVHEEAKHLIHLTDMDKDGLLSKEEVLENYKVFAGSETPQTSDDWNEKHEDL